MITSQQIFQTPPSTQPHVQTTPGSSGYKTFPNVPEGISLEEIGDFGFANDEQVKRLEKKVEEVLVDNKKLLDREKNLVKRTEIDILKVKVAELEEEKARRHEQNKYFKLKNKELEAANARKEHGMFMRFEEIQVEDVRARRQAEIHAERKNKGKGVEGISDVSERSIIPAIVYVSPVQNPRRYCRG
ncbi:hypothetical protein Hanom_Chr17g01573381 [Helianthus anomalus]